MSEKQYRDKIVAIKKQQATDETNRGKARAAAGKHRAEAAKELQKITPRTSASMARTSQRNAENLEKRAQAEDKKVTDLSVKLSRSAGELATAEENLSREIKSTAKKEEDRKKAEARTREQADARRQQREKSHAREIARLTSPTVHYVMVQPPKPEVLRVLYMTANPEMHLRTEVEVRDVQQAVKRALHRDLIDVQYRPAATPEDLLDGLNDVRPHVVHFSGHAGDAAMLFENASVDSPEGHEVPFELLARALGATAEPPKLLVLNGCDTLDGAGCCLRPPPWSSPWQPRSVIWPLAPSPQGSTPRLPQRSRSGRRYARGQSCWTSWAWTRAGSPTCSPATTWPSTTWSWSESRLSSSRTARVRVARGSSCGTRPMRIVEARELVADAVLGSPTTARGGALRLPVRAPARRPLLPLLQGLRRHRVRPRTFIEVDPASR